MQHRAMQEACSSSCPPWPRELTPTVCHLPRCWPPLCCSHYAPGGNYFECSPTGLDGRPDCNSFVKNVFTVGRMAVGCSWAKWGCRLPQLLISALMLCNQLWNGSAVIAGCNTASSSDLLTAQPKQTACQNATGDLGCAECSGAACTACYRGWGKQPDAAGRVRHAQQHAARRFVPARTHCSVHGVMHACDVC